MRQLSDELAGTFREWAEDDESVLDRLWPYCNPAMTGRERARKAVLLTMASAGDKNGMRGRLHTLMVGPPGTGKTALRNWVKKNAATSMGIGPKSSEAGLKGDASGNELTPGALSMASGGLLCIEELDKFGKGDRDALYESMSDGLYEITQGEIRTEVRAEVRAVATCNDASAFKPALKDRFDFYLEMEEYGADETAEVTDHLYSNFAKAFIKDEPVEEKRVVPAYLDWIDAFQPDATEECLDSISNMKNYLVKQEGFAGGVRKKEAWLRCAFTVAKVERRDMTPDDFITSIELMHPELDVTDALEAVRDKDFERLYS